jgi:hypothetical protein
VYTSGVGVGAAGVVEQGASATPPTAVRTVVTDVDPGAQRTLKASLPARVTLGHVRAHGLPVTVTSSVAGTVKVTVRSKGRVLTARRVTASRRPRTTTMRLSAPQLRALARRRTVRLQVNVSVAGAATVTHTTLVRR